MIRINLLKPETKEIRETPAEGAPEYKGSKRPNIGSMIFLLLIIALAGAFFYQKRLVDTEKAKLEEVKREKKELQYVVAKLDELQKRKDSLEMKIGLITNLKAQQELAIHTMDEMSKLLPEWVWLTETSYDSRSIQIKGNSLSNNLIADYISSLENSPYFEGVNLISSTQKKTQTNQYLEFSLTASIVNPNAPKPLPVPAKESKTKNKKGRTR